MKDPATNQSLRWPSPPLAPAGAAFAGQDWGPRLCGFGGVVCPPEACGPVSGQAAGADGPGQRVASPATRTCPPPQAQADPPPARSALRLLIVVARPAHCSRPAPGHEARSLLPCKAARASGRLAQATAAALACLRAAPSSLSRPCPPSWRRCKSALSSLPTSAACGASCACCPVGALPSALRSGTFLLAGAINARGACPAAARQQRPIVCPAGSCFGVPPQH